MKPLVSIIVPVYNTEKYLEQCIESLLNQTLTNIELIIVDDDSKDRSREVICSFLSDKRIKTIFKNKNEGVSAARNDGLKLAQGDYVGFVDSDDFVSLNMYETMYSAFQNHECDIVTCGFIKYGVDGTTTDHKSTLSPKMLIDNIEMLELLKQSHKKRFLWYACRNLYKRELIIENKIYFDNKVKLGEDSLFNLQAYFYANKVAVLEDCLYYYRSNPESATSKQGKDYLEESLVELHNKKLSFYESYGLKESCMDDLSGYVISHQLPMMLSNATHLSNVDILKRIKYILSLKMVRNSLKRTPFINTELPKGIQAIIILSKLKQASLLKSYLSR